MLFSKGKKIMEDVGAHFESVVESYDRFCHFLDEYLAREASPEALRLCSEIDDIEKKADAQRRAVVDSFQSGTLLPQTRSEILQLMEMSDHIANMVQDISRLMIFEKVSFPEDLKLRISDIALQTKAQLDVLEKAIGLLFNDYEQILKDYAILHQIKRYESAVDSDEQLLIKDLFEKDLTLAEKIHAKDFISKIADISDEIEDIADAIQIMVVFRKV